MGERRIAAFDFDGTMSTRDTLLPFLARTCGRRTFARSLRRASQVAVRARLEGARTGGSHHRDVAKEVLIRELMAGRSASWLEDVGEAYARDVLPGQLRPEMVNQVNWHRENGHELVLVSASLDAYLGPFGRAHGFDQVIAVTLGVDGIGQLTGELDRPNVRGPEKALRLREWLGGDEPAFTWAYGNSSGDKELLEMAHQPVWVGRRRSQGSGSDDPGTAASTPVDPGSLRRTTQPETS